MPKWYMGIVAAIAAMSLFAGVGATIVNPLIAIAAWFLWLFFRNLVRAAKED